MDQPVAAPRRNVVVDLPSEPPRAPPAPPASPAAVVDPNSLFIL
jgi:hypothetical protein